MYIFFYLFSHSFIHATVEQHGLREPCPHGAYIISRERQQTKKSTMEKIKQSKVDGPSGYLAIFNGMIRARLSQVTFEPKQEAGGDIWGSRIWAEEWGNCQSLPGKLAWQVQDTPTPLGLAQAATDT